MPEEVKFTEEELTQVQNIQRSYTTIQNQFGQLKLAQIKLDEDEVQLEENLNQLKEEERTFLSGITKKYGQGVWGMIENEAYINQLYTSKDIQDLIQNIRMPEVD